VELRHLRYFVAVAEEATFVAAARRLGVAQPALTRKIHALERELEVELLERTPKGTHLTPAGDVIKASASHLLREVDAAVERARGSGLGVVGRCVICAGVRALGSGLVGRIVERVHSRYPDIELGIIEGALDRQLQALLHHDADIGIGIPAPAGYPGLLSETVGYDVFDSAVISERHPLSHRPQLRLADLAGETFIGYRSDAAGEFTRATRAEFARQHFTPAAIREYDDVFSVSTAVEAGQGWTLLHRDGASLLVRGVRLVPLSDFRMPLPHAITRRADERRPVVFNVMDVMRAVMQEERAAQDGREPAQPPTPPPPAALAARTSAVAPSSTIELRHLRYFCAVVDAGSFGRAAEQLGLTQPALSRQVADLERLVAVPLLERAARGVTATPAGESFVHSARRILEEVDGLPAEAQRARRGAIARCVVGSLPTTLARQMVRTLLRDCAIEKPELQLLLEEVATPEQPEALRAGRIDLGICHPSPLSVVEERGIDRSQLAVDTMNCALVASSTPLATRSSLALHELENVPFLFAERSFQPELYDMIYGQFERLGFRPRVDDTYDGLRTVWQLVARGHGWAMGFASQWDDPPPGTAAVPIDELSIPWGLDLLLREDESRSVILEIAERLHEIGRAAVVSPRPPIEQRVAPGMA
jgi:DNA-binding transcriptional LysR family regulator